MNVIPLHWNKKIYLALQIRNGIDMSKFKQNKQNRMFKNGCRFMGIINKKSSM